MPLVKVRPDLSSSLMGSAILGLRWPQQELMPLVQVGGALRQLLGCAGRTIQDLFCSGAAIVCIAVC